MNPKKEITSVQLPKTVMAALREYCEEQSKSLNEVICYYLGEGLALTSSAALTDALEKHSGSTAGARATLQVQPKMGRPRGGCGKESDWSMMHDIASMLLDGDTTYKIAKAMQITYMKARWIIKRDADQLWKLQRQIEVDRERKADNKAKLNAAMELRAAFARGAITKEEFDAGMNELIEQAKTS
jgi:hypothetical protein